MPLLRNSHPTFISFHWHLRFSGASFCVLWPNQRAQRWFSNTTPASTHSSSWGRSKRTQGQVFRSPHLQRDSSAAAHPTPSFLSVQPFVREPFTILFCGRGLFSCMVFEEVYTAKEWEHRDYASRLSPHDIQLTSVQTDVWNNLQIVTNPDTMTGRRGSRLNISPLKTVGESLGVPVHTIPEDKVAFRKWLPPPPFTPHSDSSGFQNASHILITASFGRILPASILSLFPSTQCLNVHPSLLPAYRGPAPIQRALMAGEQETGVCVIEMGEVSRKAGKPADAGRIWAMDRMRLPADANFLEIQGALAELGGKLLVNVLRDMLLGTAQSRPQEAITSTTAHAPLITARDSAIQFTSQTALVIARLERAIGHQRSLTVAGALPDGRGVAMAGLRVVPAELWPVASSTTEYPGTAYYSSKTRSLVVKCAEGTWLSVERLQTQDRAMLEAKEWWNGIKGKGWVRDGLFNFVVRL